MRFKNASQRKAVMAKMKRSPEKYVINSKKWFDKTYGNTYHAVSVKRVKDDKEVYRDEFEYGYGEQWKQTAYDGLVKKGLVKEENRFNHALNKKRFIYVDGGYGLKRELKKV